MRRYGRTTDGVIVPGKNAGLKLALAPEPETCSGADCEPAATGLFWFSDTTGDYTEVVEAAYLLPKAGDPPVSVAAGPVLAMAKLTGETCGDEVTWATAWAPADEEAPGEPALKEDGAYLVVYPTADTEPGELTVSATFGGATYGPILLGVSRFSCASYGLAWDENETYPCGDETCQSTMIDMCPPGLDPDEVVLTATLSGDITGCTIEWTIDDSAADTLDYVLDYAEDSPVITLTAQRTREAEEPYACLNSGALAISATVTCGAESYGPFTIYFGQFTV